MTAGMTADGMTAAGITDGMLAGTGALLTEALCLTLTSGDSTILPYSLVVGSTDCIVGTVVRSPTGGAILA